MMGADLSFISELEHAIANGSSERRSQILQRITDLFVLGSARFSDDDIVLFDDVIGRLAAKIEQAAQVLLATRLAPIANSPPKIIRTLAFNDAIEVAGPVLSQSPRLDEETLVELASQKGQGHMLAIAHRPSLSEAVTTVLVKRGDRDVVTMTVGNSRRALFQPRLCHAGATLRKRRQPCRQCGRPAGHSVAHAAHAGGARLGNRSGQT